MIYHQQCSGRLLHIVVWAIFWLWPASSMLTVFSEVCHYTRIRCPFVRHIVKYANSDPRGSGIKISFESLDLLDDISNCSPTFSPPNKTLSWKTEIDKWFLWKFLTIFFGQFRPVLRKEKDCLIFILAEFKIEKFPLMEWNTPVVNLANTITLFASATSNSNISTLQKWFYLSSKSINSAPVT